MPAVIITMLVILLVAAAIIAIVAMGMQGHAREVNPELADAMETTARHLNGDAQPPRGLVTIFGEIDELPSADLRDIPARIRSMRSARSAASATSASIPEADDADAHADAGTRTVAPREGGEWSQPDAPAERPGPDAPGRPSADG